jgi:hypothetical protein
VRQLKITVSVLNGESYLFHCHSGGHGGSDRDSVQPGLSRISFCGVVGESFVSTGVAI